MNISKSNSRETTKGQSTCDGDNDSHLIKWSLPWSRTGAVKFVHLPGGCLIKHVQINLLINHVLINCLIKHVQVNFYFFFFKPEIFLLWIRTRCWCWCLEYARVEHNLENLIQAWYENLWLCRWWRRSPLTVCLHLILSSRRGRRQSFSLLLQLDLISIKELTVCSG